ncbi:hypothetical protein [Robertkochia solimangrovi]|uniref:hypothetical protein n=1 Tax=Robertkochia solimangrovi TaxID=2213046 RepID=UPI00117DA915|nr:hypothetical protein [Robertkochia solimangrovi]TRZ42168.1 hypothetical protein DMZ48_14135 [Robertkochia solimangrovi]
MRIGDIEGTPEEIKDLVDNQGLDIGKYLKATPSISNKRNHNIGLFISIAIFLILNICVWTINFSDTYEKIAIVILLALICFITILIHQRHENFMISGLVILFSIVIMSVCLDFITPKDALEKIDKENPLNNKITE